MPVIRSASIRPCSVGAEITPRAKTRRAQVRTQEEHVLQEMRQPGDVLWVAERPDPNVHRGGGFISGVVGDKQHREAIVQLNIPAAEKYAMPTGDGTRALAEPTCSGARRAMTS